MAITSHQPFEIDSVDDPLVAAVLKLVHDTVGRPVTVAKLCKRAGLSRRCLEQRFRAALGCSPMQAARRVNLERAAGMLRETTHAIKEIAKHCCFGSAVHLCVAFKQQYGICPSDFRRQGRLRPSENGRSPPRPE
jgi:LacI family transcriptional regulator